MRSTYNFGDTIDEPARGLKSGGGTLERHHGVGSHFIVGNRLQVESTLKKAPEFNIDPWFLGRELRKLDVYAFMRFGDAP